MTIGFRPDHIPAALLLIVAGVAAVAAAAVAARIYHLAFQNGRLYGQFAPDAERE